MARNGVTALSLVVLLALLEIGCCTRCYQCTSELDPKCNDPFTPDESMIVECYSQESQDFNNEHLSKILPPELVQPKPVQPVPRFCHKFIMQSGLTIRSCLDLNPISRTTCDFLEKQEDVNKKSKYCNLCDKDLCNGN